MRGVSEKLGVCVASLDGKTPVVRVLDTRYQARYDALTRSLLYVENGTLMARRLELDPPRLTGDPKRVAEGVAASLGAGSADFSISAGGVLFYRRGSVQGKAQFAWLDRGGRKLETLADPMEDVGLFFQLSPDGARVAYAAGAQRLDIWVLDVRRSTRMRLTVRGGATPVWTPDGKQIYYNCGAGRGVCRKAADGSGEEEVVSTSLDVPSSISPDGSTVLLAGNDILALRLGGKEVPQPWLQTPFNEAFPAFSPDGRWVAYQSNESGRSEVYVQGYPERRGKVPVSQAGGNAPHWSADGRELYWIAPDRMLMAMPVTSGPGGIEAGKPTPLFRVPLGTGFPWFEPDRDGKRFLVAERVGIDDRELPMVVIQNWPALAGVQR